MSLVDFPVELLKHIATYLDGRSALRLGQVCHTLHRVCEDVLVHCSILERILEAYAAEYNDEIICKGEKTVFRANDSLSIPRLSVSDDIIVPLLMLLRSPQHPECYANALAEVPYQWFSKLANILLEGGSNGGKVIIGLFDWGRLLAYPSECKVFIRPAMAFTFSIAIMYSRASGHQSTSSWLTQCESLEKSAAINRLLFRHSSSFEFSALFEAGMMYRSYEDFIEHRKINRLSSTESIFPSPPLLHQIPLSNICRRFSPPLLIKDTKASIFESYGLNFMSEIQFSTTDPVKIASGCSAPHTSGSYSRSAKYLRTGTWLGFYTYDSPFSRYSDIPRSRHDCRQYSPLRMSDFVSYLVSHPDLGERLEYVSKGVDRDGPFRLKGNIDMQSGLFNMMQQYYEDPTESLWFEMQGSLTPFGIVGLWKQIVGEPYKSWDGRFWIWRTTWTRGSELNEVDGLTSPLDIQFT